MAGEKKPARGMYAHMRVVDDSAFINVPNMFPAKEQKRAIVELNELHREAKKLLNASLVGLTGCQAAIKNRTPGDDYEQIMRLARQISCDTETFKNRLDVIQQKIPTEPSDRAVVSSLHIATELQQWTEDWSNVVGPLIDSVENMLERKDV